MARELFPPSDSQTLAVRPSTDNILVGCSGYHYADWVGQFYPPETKPKDYLKFYLSKFSALEVNQTFYRPPTLKGTSEMARRMPPDVHLAVKLPKLFTHENTATQSDAKTFREAMKPLQDAGILGCVLAQFPFSFKPNRQTGDELRRMVDWLSSVRLAVEIRNAGWLREGFYTYLRQAGVALCAIDAPSLPGLPPSSTPTTADFGYVRFHGRNQEAWWEHQRPEERYTYLYSKDELREWSGRLVQMSKDVKEIYVFFNNHFEGRAPGNALTLRALLDESLSAK